MASQGGLQVRYRAFVAGRSGPMTANMDLALLVFATFQVARMVYKHEMGWWECVLGPILEAFFIYNWVLPPVPWKTVEFLDEEIVMFHWKGKERLRMPYNRIERMEMRPGLPKWGPQDLVIYFPNDVKAYLSPREDELGDVVALLEQRTGKVVVSPVKEHVVEA